MLDNFEHLVDGADLVADLLQVSSGLKILITSRERLHLSAEVVFTLGGMPLSGVDQAEEAHGDALGNLGDFEGQATVGMMGSISFDISKTHGRYLCLPSCVVCPPICITASRKPKT